MGRQLDWLEAYVAARREEGSGAAETQSAAAGRAFGLQEALCHNDLLSGNILRAHAHAHARAAEEGGGASDARQVFLIDYEYAAYNYRAFDLANHFSGKILASTAQLQYNLALELRPASPPYSEHCGFEYDFLRTLPSEDFMMAFARHYLGACAGTRAALPASPLPARRPHCAVLDLCCLPTASTASCLCSA
jgi:Ser/Thr protein kinase RdoA (MazF antagonist)